MLVLVNQCSADETKRRASSERASEQKTVYYLGAWNRLNVIKTLSCLHSCSSSRFNMDGDQIPRSNFDSFWRAVITVFQVRKWYRWIFVWSFFPSSGRVLPESSERQEIAGLKHFLKFVGPIPEYLLGFSRAPLPFGSDNLSRNSFMPNLYVLHLLCGHLGVFHRCSY